MTRQEIAVEMLKAARQGGSTLDSQLAAERALMDADELLRLSESHPLGIPERRTWRMGNKPEPTPLEVEQNKVIKILAAALKKIASGKFNGTRAIAKDALDKAGIE